MSRSLIAAFAIVFPAIAAAEAPHVVADIAPVHGLVSRVMEGVGEPALLIRQGASPHGYSLKPSEAGALEKANAVFYVGPELTPNLVRPIETLAVHAEPVLLLELADTVKLESRTETLFDAVTHDHDHEHEHEHEHDDHGHSHEGTDPHAWLDPENGRIWTQAIAAELSRIDPDNAATYQANAAAAVAEIDQAEADTREALAPLKDLRFVGFHDAYQYFENRFGIHAVGSIALSDAAPPGPARIAALRDAVAETGVTCALAEPQFDANLIGTVFEGTEVKTAVIDPVGSQLETGPGFYPNLIRSFGEALTACK